MIEDLWIEPAAIGRGYGRLLWTHAVATARASGASAIELDAAPNAPAFYERMGARKAGETPATFAACRRLPRMRFELR